MSNQPQENNCVLLNPEFLSLKAIQVSDQTPISKYERKRGQSKPKLRCKTALVAIIILACLYPVYFREQNLKSVHRAKTHSIKHIIEFKLALRSKKGPKTSNPASPPNYVDFIADSLLELYYGPHELQSQLLDIPVDLKSLSITLVSNRITSLKQGGKQTLKLCFTRPKKYTYEYLLQRSKKSSVHGGGETEGKTKGDGQEDEEKERSLADDFGKICAQFELDAQSAEVQAGNRLYSVVIFLDEKNEFSAKVKHEKSTSLKKQKAN